MSIEEEQEKRDIIDLDNHTIKMTSYVYMIMPTLGIAGALSFNRKDIIIFLKQFEKLCKGHRIMTDKGILEQIPNYYMLKIGNYMENTAAFKGNN